MGDDYALDTEQSQAYYFHMKDKQHWMDIAKQVSEEQDPVKLQKLILELTRLLLEKEERVFGEPRKPQ
jgi:hypothetical protein